MSFPPLPLVAMLPPRQSEDVLLDNITNELVLTATRGENCMRPLGRRIARALEVHFKNRRMDTGELAEQFRLCELESFELMRKYGGRAWRSDGFEITSASPRVDERGKLWIDMIASGRPSE